MAEINIEKKKPVWPWIILVLIILLIIYFYTNSQDKPRVEREEMNVTDTISQAEVEYTKKDTYFYSIG